MNSREPDSGALRPLAHWLRAAATELHTRMPPPLPPAGLIATTSVPTRPRWKLPSRHWPALAWTLAPLAAICVLMAVFTGSQPLPPSHGFVAVAGSDRWLRLAAPLPGQGAETDAWLVQTEMPQERLAAFGLPYDPGHAATPVRAELLMRASGEVLALRIVD